MEVLCTVVLAGINNRDLCYTSKLIHFAMSDFCFVMVTTCMMKFENIQILKNHVLFTEDSLCCVSGSGVLGDYAVQCV